MTLLLLNALTTFSPSRMLLPLLLLADLPAAAAAGTGADTLSLREAVGFLGTGAGACWLLMQIWTRMVSRFTRTPAIEVEFATKAELKELKSELTASGETRRNEIMLEIRDLKGVLDRGMDGIYNRINDDAKTLSVELQAFQRVVGRLEASVNKIPGA